MTRRVHGEQGQILLLALGFITVLGLATVVLLSYTTTNLRATAKLRPVRSVQFAADGAIEGAINKMRLDTNAPCGANFFTAAESLNGQPIVVTCVHVSGTPATPTVTKTFTATCPPSGTSDCPDNELQLTATVLFDKSQAPAKTTVQKWSVTR